MATKATKAVKATRGKSAAKDTSPGFLSVIGRRLGGLGLLGGGVALALSLASHSRTDPSLSTAAGGPADNWLGGLGAYASDIVLQAFGLAAILFVPLLLVGGWRHLRLAETGSGWRPVLLGIGAALGIGTALSLLSDSNVSELPAGWGGLGGMGGAGLVDAGVALIGDAVIEGPVRLSLLIIAALGGIALFLMALALREEERETLAGLVPSRDALPTPSLRREKTVKPLKERKKERKTARPPRSEVEVAEPAAPVIAAASPRPKRPASGQQASLALGDGYELPALELLAPPGEAVNAKIDKAALERNARLLESVLEDFHVRGDIVEVKPGPVVTMYELEPASGIKASRVIQLADDIARNMSALSARVATIPGRSVIGIELPNNERDMVNMRELLASEDFAGDNRSLPIILGKNIGGEPVIADLAPMPHLLVAGTTGSGKSVGLNAMIMSLLYRLSPDECRMIMIDPKMLELSIYDDIPHLLAPVVTEPQKAIRALKWTVEQMEERYRMMASLSVRQLSGFNKKVVEARAKGKPLERKVQTGYDADTGQPTYEIEELDYAPLPQIVVVVDELADLMMTAGKEVEFLIQRLAQKARAAGIHLIMATQRPSVDVITGVIKANLPTRISFAVTSKIDSRTILGEQGAEQLLGKGDMLYMPGGKKIERVHGPFVSDEEVRAVADFWRGQGTPDYIQAVTEEPEDGGFSLDGEPTGDEDPETQQLRQAIQIVATSQKASTSYLQRQLRVGYNTAARLIERMEDEGLVGPPDHVGRRDVLIDRDGQPI
ncbi:FtsK/SpoIIIE family DNA translocase [Sphingomicrobium arenosum]|uniref:FtsK/SpoIIIE family DNA translocase n=1 Tax=Sphingomicrobium arenosum TaxID=2233861 RepID=UPI002240EC52|nr:DNA translocase FtsK 4TM domain-containing protein [Sphingomicrobium arenosum]